MNVCAGAWIRLLAWGLAYVHSAVALAALAVIFCVAVAAHDTDGVLSVMTTAAGVDLLAPSLFPELSPKQRHALAVCLTDGGDGDIRAALQFSVGSPPANSSQLLQRLSAVKNLSVDRSALDGFLRSYQNSSGATYVSKSNTSQNLGWQGERGGLEELADHLHAVTMEYWAFESQRVKAPCPSVVPYNSNTQVNGANCFFVQPDHPSDAELQDRYQQFTPMQLDVAIKSFRFARDAAAALKMADMQLSQGAVRLADLQSAWASSAAALNKISQSMDASVAFSVSSFITDWTALSNQGNCHPAFSSIQQGSAALGKDLVAAQFTLCVCCAALFLCSLGLSLLYCTMWRFLAAQPQSTMKGYAEQVYTDDEATEMLLWADNSGSSDEEPH